MAGIPVPYLGLKLLTLPTVSDMQQVLKKCAVNERREDVGAGREGRAIALLLRWGRKKEQQSRLGQERISTGSVHRHQLSGLGWGWCKTARCRFPLALLNYLAEQSFGGTGWKGGRHG